jgi:hypothetical protein
LLLVEPGQRKHSVIRFLNISFVTTDTNERKKKGVLYLGSWKKECCKNIAGAKTTEIDYGAPQTKEIKEVERLSLK